MSLTVQIGDQTFSAEWTDDDPEVRDAIEAALPLSGDASRWGDELYFNVPVDADPTNAAAEVSVGAIAYWPTGPALCLFWGPTPASHADEPRAASPVATVAQLDEPEALATIDPHSGIHVAVESEP